MGRSTSTEVTLIERTSNQTRLHPKSKMHGIALRKKKERTL